MSYHCYLFSWSISTILIWPFATALSIGVLQSLSSSLGSNSNPIKCSKTSRISSCCPLFRSIFSFHRVAVACSNPCPLEFVIKIFAPAEGRIGRSSTCAVFLAWSYRSPIWACSWKVEMKKKGGVSQFELDTLISMPRERKRVKSDKVLADATCLRNGFGQEFTERCCHSHRWLRTRRRAK